VNSGLTKARMKHDTRTQAGKETDEMIDGPYSTFAGG